MKISLAYTACKPLMLWPFLPLHLFYDTAAAEGVSTIESDRLVQNVFTSDTLDCLCVCIYISVKAAISTLPMVYQLPGGSAGG